MMDSPSSTPSRPLRVLAVTSEPPWPLDSGGHIRSFHLLTALAGGTDLRLICPVQPQHREAVEPLRDRGVHVVASPAGPRSLVSEARRLCAAMRRAEPYVMYRRHAWPGVFALWSDEVHAFRPDVLYLDHLDGLLYLNASPSRIPAVVDLHNIYSLLVRRTAGEQRSRLRRAFLRRDARLLEGIERRAARECAALFAVSRQEAAHVRSIGAKAVHVIPNGVDYAPLADLPTGRTGEPPAVLFVGTMSWGPNASAARFLARDVMPKLRARFPGARLLVVGRDPPPDLQDLSGHAGVEVTGRVRDVRPYLGQGTVMAVPLDAGGGTRLKILEAFAAGLPVVSTAVGAEGIDATPGTHLAVADRPGFANAVAEILTSPERAARMALAARELARSVYDWDLIGRNALSVVRSLGERSDRSLDAGSRPGEAAR